MLKIIFITILNATKILTTIIFQINPTPTNAEDEWKLLSHMRVKPRSLID